MICFLQQLVIWSPENLDECGAQEDEGSKKFWLNLFSLDNFTRRYIWARMENKLNTERLSSPVKGCWKDINFGETLVLKTDAMAKKKRKTWQRKLWDNLATIYDLLQLFLCWITLISISTMHIDLKEQFRLKHIIF